MRNPIAVLMGVALAVGFATSQPARDFSDVQLFELTCEIRNGFTKALDLNRVLTHMKQLAQNQADERGCGPVELVRFECHQLYDDFYQCEFFSGRWDRSEQDPEQPMPYLP